MLINKNSALHTVNCIVLGCLTMPNKYGKLLNENQFERRRELVSIISSVALPYWFW